MNLAEFEEQHVRPKQGRTLIVGSKVYKTRTDRRTKYANVVGVDMEAGEGVDLVADLEEPQKIGTFAHIECCSVLEHSRRPWLLAANIERMLEPGGTLHVSVPFIWRVHAYPSDYWRLTVEGVRALFPAIAWETLRFCSASTENGHERRIPSMWSEGLLYFARTEVAGFGVRPG